MSKKIDPIPVGPRAITPYLTIKGAAKGIEFYKKAFGAKELMRWTGPDGRVGHAEIEISGTPVFISDEHPAIGVISPETLGGSSVGLHLLVEDAYATFKRALEAGAEQITPVEEEPWGQRSGTLKDPFGHRWFVTTRTAELSAAEMDAIGKAAGYKTLN
ncbi:MAG: VOC family protein [Candidatus Binatus sp.]